jgi:ACS family tartrate transporter-like MFS transporter
MSTFPYLLAAFVMVIWAQRSDRTGERRWHAVIPSIVCSAGLAISAFVGGPVLAFKVWALAENGMPGQH